MTDWTNFADWVGPIGAPITTEHTGFLLAEDEAMKKYVSGLTVPDKTGTTKVGVWFRWPESERRIQYPFITIDLLDAQPSYDRWTSQYYLDPSAANGSVSFEDPISGQEVRKGLYQPSVSPTVLPPDTYDEDLQNLVIEQYLMYTLLYQITVHCRDALHDRYLMSRFITDIFPPRPFWIGVDADSTWRRSEMVEMMPADTMETTEAGKRIFRKVYTISMDAEIPQMPVSQIEKILRIHIDLYGQNPISVREPVDHHFDDVHTAAEPINVIPTP